MEAIFIVSRSIIQNNVYDKFQQSRFQNHKKAIKRLRTKGSIDNCNDSPKYLNNLQKFKSAHRSVSRIFDKRVIENQSLYRRLVDIEQNRGRSQSNNMQNSTQGASKNFYKQQERKRIEHENNLIKLKIQEQKRNRLTVSKIRKQIKEHDKLVNHAKKMR